ncbi:MAG: DNA gyrase/topoisomerase IV subunit A, partial [Alistipes sp.]|nr:DNA gyrase/topoisomerase IV subunit A [Alistipes sp.]
TKGTPKSELLYMSVNPNGEAEVLKIYFRPRPRLKKVITDLDFSTIAIKGRAAAGNLFSRYSIHKIVLKEKGTSTLGGQDIWFDEDVRRLNTDGRGILLGEFKGDDKLVVWTSKNQYYITGFGVDQHFPDETVRVERYVAGKVYSLCYFDREQNYYYIKRFQLEPTEKILSFLEGENAADFVCITGVEGAKLIVTYKGAHATRPADEFDVDSFIGVKSHRAKGKRVTTYDVDTMHFVEPEVVDEPEVEDANVEDVDIEAIDGADVEQDTENVASTNVVSMGAADEDVVLGDPEQLNLF